MSEVRSFGFGVCLKLVASKEGKHRGFSQVEELGVEVGLSEKQAESSDRRFLPSNRVPYLCTVRDHNLIARFICDSSGPGFKPSSL